MVMWRVLARRTVWAVFVIYLFLSLIFFGLALTPDPSEPLGGGEPETERYGDMRDSTIPLSERYLTFLGWYATLDLGDSIVFEQSATDVLGRAFLITGLYLVPGVLLASAVSVLTGVYSALHPTGVVDRIGRVISQLGLGIPAVVIADLLAFAVGQAEWYPAFESAGGVISGSNLLALSLPMLVTAFNLWAVQTKAVRGETAAYIPREFVRTLRAGGAGDRRISRHVLKNAAPSLVALFVSEVLLTLVVSMYVVEVAFGIPGFGLVSYVGFFRPDAALIVPAVIVPVIVGIVGNTLQDVAVSRLDPRVDG